MIPVPDRNPKPKAPLKSRSGSGLVPKKPKESSPKVVLVHGDFELRTAVVSATIRTKPDGICSGHCPFRLNVNASNVVRCVATNAVLVQTPEGVMRSPACVGIFGL